MNATLVDTTRAAAAGANANAIAAHAPRNAFLRQAPLRIIHSSTSFPLSQGSSPGHAHMLNAAAAIGNDGGVMIW